ncbi:MAG TPA: four helix bundle protein [Patescibacteria group bacterium]|nr:four helix bundle protein [Patescibacteria group bacterium]
MTVKNFQEIQAWQKAHQLVLEVYQVTKKFPTEELYCLVNQIRRAVISIASNIAEGYKRKSTKDSEHFYNMAEGSLEEVKYQLILSKDLKYITAENFDKLFNLAEEVGRLLNGWKRSQSL